MESGEGAEACPHRLVKGSAGSNLRCDCGDCPRGANLKDVRCLPRVLRTLDRNYGITSVTLSHFVEAQYTGDSMRALERMLGVKRLLDRMTTRSPGPGGRPISDCGGCALNPGMLFSTLTGIFLSDQAKFHDAYLKAAIALNQGKGPACRECIEKTKGDFVYLGGQVVPFWRFLQGKGGRDIAIASRRGLKGRAPTTFGELFQSFNEFSPRELQSGLLRVLDGGRRIRPTFSASWVFPDLPPDAERITGYSVEGSEVALYRPAGETEVLYYVLPKEYQLPIKQVKLVLAARDELRGHYPRNVDMSRPDQVRAYVEKVGERLIYSLAKRTGVELGATRAQEAESLKALSSILAKYTAGFGISEVLLSDPHVQDIYIDAPASENFVYATLGGIDDPRVTGKCRTNVCLGDEDAESLLARFRYESGRPFSEAMPVLETDLDMYNTRVTAIGRPLSPGGIAIALRRHSTDPWTLLKLMRVRSINSLGSGLLSFLIDGRSTMLVAGSRGAGKSSLLSALMFEFPQSQRILTIEDTLELPGPEMQRLGFKVQSLFVQSTLGGKGELTADDALRVSLRLGESSIVLGEVRGQEARTLYEAMRAGTAGSAVMGTIHGNSPKSVYERVVHDMGIPEKAFAATDVVVIAGLTRPKGGQMQKRRVTEIAELDKEAMEFRTLMAYDAEADGLVETEHFRSSSSRIGQIAKSWGVDYETAILNIRLRAAIREVMLEAGGDDPRFLTAEWVAKANNQLWNLIDSEGDLSDVEDGWYEWFFGQRGMA